MSKVLTNTAAWLTTKRADLVVNVSPYTAPGDYEIVVWNRAVAVNPLDWILQTAGELVFSWLKYPFILGSDVAGEVVEVGSRVSRFKVGQRVLGHAVGSDRIRNTPAQGGFQTYTVLLEHMAAPIPDEISFEDASVLPLGATTAACALFQKDQLALQLPSLDPVATGRTLLVWGGSTSVGCNAIQLAVAAGYQVIAICSRRNFDYLKKLGASQVFDYNNRSVIKDVVDAFCGKTIAGALAIGMGSVEACLDIVHQTKGHKAIAMATFPLDFKKMNRSSSLYLQFLRQIPRVALFSVSMLLKSKIRGIRTKAIFGTTIVENEVSRAVYVDFLPHALAKRTFIPAPGPHVVGNGLEDIQKALDFQKSGVSAKKVVVCL